MKVAPAARLRYEGITPSLSLRLAMTAAGKIIDNRALRAVIAGTGFRQRQQVRAYFAAR
jgi:hypothetical protein